MMILINENELDEWVRGNSLDAQRVIVELVWRLVSASCPNPRERRFPLGDSIGQHGPDGILDTPIGFDPFVPEGQSFWEIGTGLKAGDKATSDYNELTLAIPGQTRLETTFIFITPLSGRRDWEHTWKKDAQATWLEKRRQQGEWKQVCVIDGTKLIDWLHQFPAVELWLAQKISGLPSLQIEVPELRWNILKSYGEPPQLNSDVFLANRTDACAKLKEVLEDTIAQLKLTTHYPDQVADFVSAYLASLDVESRIDASTRCLIISGSDAWNTLCTYREKHIFIADSTLDLNCDSGTKLIQKARQAGHRIVFGGPSGGIPDPMSLALKKPTVYQVRDALKKAGYGEERARTLAQKSDGNISSLLRLLQNLSLLPEWAEQNEAAELAIAVVLGAWSDQSEADRSVAENLSGNSYGGWIKKMREIALRPATPLIQQDGNWKFIARYEGWYALGPRIFDNQLDKLNELAVTVLRESDPQFELPPEERYAARIHGKVLAHSELLRVGLAESLAMLGNHPTALTSCTFGKAESTAVLAVRKILADCDWVQWASLDDLLPLLAEAAPGEFLDAVETALHCNPCPFDNIFAQEGKGVMGRTYISGLLWALETLAWDADQLIRVVICLGELAARDPGGQWANRPTSSLTTILLPWLPQTCAPIPKRVTAVKSLLTEHPDIGWKLLLTLLPQYHSVSSGTRKPAWRTTIPEDWKEGATGPDHKKQVFSYSELASTVAIKDMAKLAELIEHLENLPQPAFQQLLKSLSSDTILGIPEKDRLRLWNELVDLVTRHRKFADAQWAMKTEEVDKIAAIATRLAPKSPFFHNQRLFSERDFDLYEEKGSIEEQHKELEDRRQKAIQEVADVGGVEAVLAFAKAVQSSWRVGIAIDAIADENADGVILPHLLESEEKSLVQFVGGFVWSRFRSRGWQWVDSIEFSQWTSTQIGQLLSFLPFTNDTWERSKRFLGQEESAYWTKTAANPYEAENNLEIAIDQLIQHGRPNAAIRCIHRMLRSKDKIPSERAIKALLEAVSSPESPNAMDAYEMVEIIKALQDDTNANPDDLYSVEWAYLPVLEKPNDKASPKFLERRLAKEPGFFCEAIRLVFRSNNEEKSAEEPTEETKVMARNAYRLLNGWRIPPGMSEEGPYDGNALKSWLDAVVIECTETGHLNIALSMVGHVLIHVPSDPNGLWIHRLAAAALNTKDAQDMRNGFSTALFNSRGVHYVDPTGKPEMELSSKYRGQAEAVEEAGYSRLATTLRELAETYKQEAKKLSSREPFDD